MRKTVIALSLLITPLCVVYDASSAFAGRGSSTGAIQSAIRSNNADAIISELERAERLICGACVEPVRALLDHQDYRVREAAAWWFARRPALKAEIRDVAIAALYAGDSIAARNGADALGTFRHPDAIDALAFASSRTDFTAEARAAAVQALGTIAHRDALPAITAALADSDALVRAAAVNAYAELRGTFSGDELAPLAADPDVSVRRQATARLGGFATASARPQLEAALGDADAIVRRNAAWALGRIGDSGSRPALEAAAANDESSLVRSIATAALRELR